MYTIHREFWKQNPQVFFLMIEGLYSKTIKEGRKIPEGESNS